MHLRVLVVEDSENDTHLVVRSLRRAGYEVDWRRVETAPELKVALDSSPWDLVISDFNLPQFSASGALSVFQDSRLDVPFILVSGTIGEDNAVALMKAGAHDYVRKDDLGRLPTVVQRELTEARLRRQAVEAQAINQEILSALPSHIALLDRDGVVVATNDAWDRFAREQGTVDLPRSLVGTDYLEVCRRSTVWSRSDSTGTDGIAAVLSGESSGFMTEYSCQCPGQRRWFLMSVTPLTRGRGGAVVSHLEVTAQRQIEEQVRDREARLSAMLDTAADGIITTDIAGVVESFNRSAEQIFGLAESQVVGKSLRHLIPRGLGDPGAWPLSAGREVQGRRQDGRQFPIELSLSEVRLPGRTIFTAFVRDITERKRVELALRESEGGLARAQEIAHLGSFTGQFRSKRSFRWSAQMFRIVGRDPAQGPLGLDEFIGQHVHPADRARLRDSVRRMGGRGDRYTLEFRVLRPDGSVRHVQSLVETIPGPNGRVQRVAGTLQDVTERRKGEILGRLQFDAARILAAAQSLDEAVPELLRSIAESLGWRAGEFWEVDAESGGLRILKAWHATSPALAEFINQGWSPRLGDPAWLARQALPAGEPRWVSDLSQCTEFGRRRSAARARLRSALAFPARFEGRTLAVMVFYSTRSLDADPELIGLVGSLGGQIGQFIDRKQTADALRRSEASLARAQKIAQLGSYEVVVEPQRRASWSTEVYRILGLGIEERLSLEQFVDDRVHPDDRARVQSTISQLLRRGIGYDLQCRIVRPDGRVRHVQVVGEAVAARRGRTVKVVGTLMDITERLELEREALEAREREQRRFGRDLHDGLGQRLTALELFGQALSSDVQKKAPNLQPQVQNLTHQLREAVTEARLLSHGLSPVPLEDDGLMRALEELAMGVRTMTKVQCRFICPKPVLLKEVNVATQLYRIAQEAVNNALKHSGAGRVQIRLSRNSPRVVLLVEDDGCGFSGPDGDDMGMGMRVMKYRAEMIGATLEVGPAPRRGLRITCSLWNAL
ncbi:MAG: PAS domain S-box protein [Limisphaerales bacterium]